MNREMRRLQEREERRRKREESGKGRKPSAVQSRTTTPVERKPFFRRVRDYLHEVRQELRKVTWPTQEQMVAFTTVTLITTLVLTGVIFGFDVVSKRVFLWLFDFRS